MKNLLFFLLFIPFMVNAQAPANDNPCGAINLSINNTSGYGLCTALDFNMVGTTYNSTFNNANCSGDSKPDIWFKFIMPASSNVKISTSLQAGSSDNDAIMQVYTSTDCNTSVNYLTCNDDGGTGINSLMPVIILNAASGVTIYIRINQYSGLTNGLYNICVSTPPPLDNVTKIGIGVTSPDSTLDVNGNMVVRGALRVAGNLKLSGGTPGAGKVLTSDASGNGTWQTAALGVGAGTVNQTLRNNGAGWIAANNLQNDGAIVTSTGQIKIQGGSPADGKLLSSDNTGLATWEYAPYSIGFKVHDANSQGFLAGVNRKLGFGLGTTGGMYRTSDSTFGVTVSGLYTINMRISYAAFSPTAGDAVALFQNQSSNLDQFFLQRTTSANSVHFSSILPLFVGNRYSLGIYNSTNATFTTIPGAGSFPTTYFEGYLLKAN